MNKLLCAFQICFVLVFFVVNCNCLGTIKQPKRLANQQRLFPFPRIGRGGANSWDYTVEKPNRGKLFAFPRVGRPDLNPLTHYLVTKRNRNMNKGGGGVWFGPRLGRVNKRDVYLYDVPQELLYSSGNLDSQETRQVHYTPRLGRESDEEIEEELN